MEAESPRLTSQDARVWDRGHAPLLLGNTPGGRPIPPRAVIRHDLRHDYLACHKGDTNSPAVMVQPPPLHLTMTRQNRTHISHSGGEEEEKNPQGRVKLPARGSTLAGDPKREELEQPSCVEGNCEISIRAKQSISGSEWERGIAMCSIPTR